MSEKWTAASQTSTDLQRLPETEITKHDVSYNKTHRSEDKKKTNGRSHGACALCWQSIVGLHIMCPSCSHRGHSECIWRLLENEQEEDVGYLWCKLGCGCSCDQQLQLGGMQTAVGD